MGLGVSLIMRAQHKHVARALVGGSTGQFDTTEQKVLQNCVGFMSKIWFLQKLYIIFTSLPIPVSFFVSLIFSFIF